MRPPSPTSACNSTGSSQDCDRPRLFVGLVAVDPARYAELTAGRADREIARLSGLSPVTVARIRQGLPVQGRVVQQLATALDAEHRSPSLDALLGRAG